MPAIRTRRNTLSPITAANTELLSDADLAHLFTTKWFADYEATKAYNLEQDPEGKTAWLHGTQFKEEMFFKNAGIMWKNRVSGNGMEEIDFKSVEFKTRFKLIDKNHLAMRSGEHWVIYSDERP